MAERGLPQVRPFASKSRFIYPPKALPGEWIKGQKDVDVLLLCSRFSQGHRGFDVHAVREGELLNLVFQRELDTLNRCLHEGYFSKTEGPPSTSCAKHAPTHILCIRLRDGHPRVLTKNTVSALDEPSGLAVVKVNDEDVDSALVVPFDVSCLAGTTDTTGNDILFIHGFQGKNSRYSAMATGVVSGSLRHSTFEGASSLSGFDPRVHANLASQPIYRIRLH